MELTSIKEKLSNLDHQNQDDVEKVVSEVVSRLSQRNMKILDLVQSLDSVLTNGNFEIRYKGVKFLCDTITVLKYNSLSEKEIELLNEFLCLRFLDHKSMQKTVLNCFMYFLNCDHMPTDYERNLVDFLKSKITVQDLEPDVRFQIYSILNKVIILRSNISPIMEGDFIYSIVHLIEGEGHPENLMLCFKLVSFTLKNFKNLEPYIDDIFEWLSSYYPVDYTPDEDDRLELKISRVDIVDALYECFFATSLNSENLQTLLLEKLDSSLMSTKLESFQCLARCYETFPVDTIKSYISSIWTAIRVECLRKKELIDPHLLNTCHETLTKLAKKLLEDEDLYLTFFSDMYEELSIAFRKLEMDLFEPASELIACVCKPRLKSFDFLLCKILPISTNALKSGEFRHLPALKNLFEQLKYYYPNESFTLNLIKHVEDLTQQLLCSELTSDGKELLKSILSTKINIKKESLDRIIEYLKAEVYRDQFDAQECLAIVCANYKRLDIITEREFNPDCSLSETIWILDNFIGLDLNEHRAKLKFSCYLKLIIHILHLSSIDTHIKFDQFLEKLRLLAFNHRNLSNLIDDVGRIHAIIFNKLSDDNLEPLLMSFVKSDYSQKIVPSEPSEEKITSQVYLPVVEWVTMSIVRRNHKFLIPFMNLMLNLLVSEQLGLETCLKVVKSFASITKDTNSEIFNINYGYQAFFLFKQKFYIVCKKEIKVRYTKLDDGIRRDLLISCLAVQLSGLPQQVYKSDSDWLLRELLRGLSRYKDSIGTCQDNIEAILVILHSAIAILMQNCCDSTSNFLDTLVDLNMCYAKRARSMKIRLIALELLRDITKSFNEQQLLNIKQSVTEQLRGCLTDKKRLVRQAAADASLRWALVGQPIGGS